jgi:hypothetical protein
MCCFSRAVRYVSSTQIFARSAAGGRQYLAYEMSLELTEELAMILPLPVPASSAEDAVRFIDLSGYGAFFRDLAKGFPELVSRGKGRFAPQSRAAPVPTLRVHDVGDFEASFVPAVKDFARLDARFRLPEATWDALPAYADWGFAVFKLRSGVRRGFFARFRKADDRRSFHPMAFEFPRRDPGALFFPTVHVHDGQVHHEARFDHTLYLQGDDGWDEKLDWERSADPAGRFVRCERAQSIVAPQAPMWRQVVGGAGKNRDVVVHRDELDARFVRGGPLFAVRFRNDWGAPNALGAVPDHPSWGRDMPAEKSAVAARLARALEERGDALGRAWGLAPYDAALPRYFSGSFPGAAPQTGPCRMEVVARQGGAMAPQALWVSTVFADVPSRERADEVTAEVRRMAEAAARV